MKKIDLDKHKFDTRSKIAVFVSLLIFGAYLQSTGSPSAGEIITLVVGLAGGSTLARI